MLDAVTKFLTWLRVIDKVRNVKNKIKTRSVHKSSPESPMMMVVVVETVAAA